MDKDKLIEEANKARQIAVCLAENIYRYLGDVITKEELKSVVDSLISDDITIRLQHLYINKDTYPNTFICGFMEDLGNNHFEIDDTDTIELLS